MRQLSPRLRLLAIATAAIALLGSISPASAQAPTVHTAKKTVPANFLCYRGENVTTCYSPAARVSRAKIPNSFDCMQAGVDTNQYFCMEPPPTPPPPPPPPPMPTPMQR